MAAACALPAAVLALAVLLPFLGKAFTIDDVTFLLQAKHILRDPLHPTALDMVFHGVRLRLSHELVTGPVMAYLLVPSVLLGGAEWAAHAIQIVFLIVAAIATASLALRLGLDASQARVAALLVVVSPAVLGMTATAMPDVPAMALAVAGVERLLAWRTTRRPITGLVSSVLLALAILSRPQVLLVLACASLWLIEEEREVWQPWRWPAALLRRSSIPVALALTLAALVVYGTRDPSSGDSIASATVGRIQLQKVAFNLASFTLHWTLAFPLVLLWPLLRGRRFLRFPRAPVAFNVGMVLAVLGGLLAGANWPKAIPFVLLAGLAVATLVDIVVDAWQRRDRTQLALGLWLLVAAATATYVQLPAKLLVPSAPAMAILISRELGSSWMAGPTRWLFLTTASICVALGVLIIRADAALAEVGRQGGREVQLREKQGAKVWMDGAWGFQWYAMAAGAEPLAETPPFPRSGDVVVAGLEARLLREKYPDKTLVFRKVFAEPGGRVNREGAGFFTNWAGPWPWVWGHGELARIEVWRIAPSPASSR
jgi:4-amino-4-deoxy-L-arabinose transferase-like glycosyltransferase